MPSGSDYDHPLWIYLGLGLRLLMTKLPKSYKKKKKQCFMVAVLYQLWNESQCVVVIWDFLDFRPRGGGGNLLFVRLND